MLIEPDEYFSSQFAFVEFLVAFKIILYDVNHWSWRSGFGIEFKQADCTFLFENSDRNYHHRSQFIARRFKSPFVYILKRLLWTYH